MAKKPIQVDRVALEKAIQEAESQNQFSTRAALWDNVAKQYNATVNPSKPLTPAVVYLRVNEWNLTIQTKRGKRGGGNGAALRNAHKAPRKSKAEKFADDPTIQAALAEMRQTTPERFHPIVEKIAAGSRLAGVQLRCLDCGGWQTGEVRKCPVNTCGLWPFRPYQDAETEAEADEPEIIELGSPQEDQEKAA